MSVIRRLQARYESKQQDWELVHNRLAFLRQAKLIETDPGNQFRLDRQIKTVEQELAVIQQELTHYEQELSQVRSEDKFQSQQRYSTPSKSASSLPAQHRVEGIETGAGDTNMDEGKQVNYKTTEEIRSPIIEIESCELTQLTLQFLKQYSRWFFNAARIRGWGAEQSGYKAFSQYSTNEIAQCLQQLFASNKLRVKTSKQGTTLYTVK
jgi:hypothetical protein